MQQASTQDAIHICTDDSNLERVRRILSANPIWAAYALADLQPEFATDCRWLTATSAAGDALALIYCGLQPPILFTMGEPRALDAVLAQADLPDAVYTSVSENHLSVVSSYYVVD